MFQDFQSVRRFQAANRLLHIVLSLTLVLGLNALAYRWYVRVDLTAGRRLSLSPETLAYLRQLSQPVDIIVTYTPEANPVFFDTVERLLQEYSYHSRREGEPFVRVEFVNIYQQRRRAGELVARYGLQEENRILVISGNRQVEIDRTDLFKIAGGQVAGFTGEQAFTGAIVDVSNPTRPKAGFLFGHGEKSIDDVNPLSGLSRLAQILRERNIDLVPFDLTGEPRVPEEIDLLFIVGPQAPYTGPEVEKLRRWMLDANGRLLLFIDPYKPHGLEDLLFDWGILADDAIMVDRGADSQSLGGDLVVRRYTPHPVSQYLIDYQLTVLFGSPRPVRPDPGAPLDERLSRVPLLATGPSSWLERSYRTQDPPVLDVAIDLPGPVAIATLAERSLGQDLGLNIPGGRLIAFGSSDFITNHRIDSFGNRSLLLQAVRWCLEAETVLNLEPRALPSFQMALSENDLRNLLLWLLLLPAGAALFGGAVFLFRRS